MSGNSTVQHLARTYTNGNIAVAISREYHVDVDFQFRMLPGSHIWGYCHGILSPNQVSFATHLKIGKRRLCLRAPDYWKHSDFTWYALHWRHNECDGVSNHQPHDCLLNRSFMRRSKETSKLRVTSICEGNSPGTGEFPAQKAGNAEDVSIWWRHHEGTRIAALGMAASLHVKLEREWIYVNRRLAIHRLYILRILFVHWVDGF